MTDPPDAGAERRPLRVRIARLPGSDDLPLPAPATAGASGLDLRAAVPGEYKVDPGARARIPTGVAIALPEGYGGYREVARSLYTDFVLPFEVTSLLLLGAMVGAVVMAKRRLD